MTLNDIEVGTEFRMQGYIWRKTASGKGDATKCEPKMGGVFQQKRAQLIQNNAEITVWHDTN